MRDARRGFSMIELLVVIAVIGILAGILLPVLSKMRERAKVAATVAAVKNLEIGLRQYDFIFGQYPPDPSAAAAGKIPASYNFSSECMVFYLGTAFRRLPDLTRGERRATKNGGPFYEFRDEYMADLDGDNNKEFIDYFGVPYKYDNVRDDSTGFTDTTAEGFGTDPRGTKAKNVNSYDIWSGGKSAGVNPKDSLGNFKP